MDVFDRERAGGTLDSYDAVELRLGGGVVVRVPPLTVEEAAAYLRLLGKSRDDADAHVRFLTEFPRRMSIEDVRLEDLGVEIEGLDDLGDLRYRDVEIVAELLGVATYETDEVRRSRAQLVFLRRFPRKVGLGNDHGLAPGDVFALGHRFVETVYEVAYGLAEDFCSHQISGPRNLVLTLSRASETREDRRSSSGSTI